MLSKLQEESTESWWQLNAALPANGKMRQKKKSILSQHLLDLLVFSQRAPISNAITLK